MIRPVPSNMFHGKNLPQFFRTYQGYYAMLVRQYGADKVMSVYRWLFSFIQTMQWGQWMVLEKVCPKKDMRGLFYFCFEMIYESDLFSQFAFEKQGDDIVIRVVEPTDEQKKRWSAFMHGKSYGLIDWYGRLMTDPSCNPDIQPEWLGFASGEGEPADEDTYNNDNIN